MAITIRLAKADQLNEIRALFFKSLSYMADKMGITIPADAYSDLEDYLERRDLYVAMENGSLVGAVTMNEVDNGLYVDTLAIHPAHQSKGLGTQLLSELELIAESRELPFLRLHTPEVMPQLHRYYENHGFRETHRKLPVHGRDSFLRVHFEKDIARSDLHMDHEHEHDRYIA